MAREKWGSRIGLILAMAGNAVGLGNFIRFPSQAAQYGGAFMIPYFLAFFLLGIPLMWVEWEIGRYGGKFGHGSLPGMLDKMWNKPIAKYLGVLGVVSPLLIVSYYMYVESWTLGYAFFSATGSYFQASTFDSIRQFMTDYISPGGAQFLIAIVFFVITVAVNFFIISRGVVQGIEKSAKVLMPLLIIFAILLAIRVLFLGTPDPSKPDNSVLSGLAYQWVPDFKVLLAAPVWLAATGQIFFTLSLGGGEIPTYASYLKKDDDIVLNGLATSSTNEFCEVILGGSIAIPAAVAFFGIAQTQAATGNMGLGFLSMPLVFQNIPLGQFFGALWFLLLFFAAITSSLAMLQPVVTFFQDEFGWSRMKSSLFAIGAAVAIALPCIFLPGVFDEVDFWAGTVGLAVLALIEIIIFGWFFDIEKGWVEMHKGADMRIPKIFKFIIKYVAPLYILAIFIGWIATDLPAFLAKGDIYTWGARIMVVVLMAIFCILIKIAWDKKAKAAAKMKESLPAPPFAAQKEEK
ncbi:MAG: sodium-dependent transporter [Candidatus Thermoplasmatota archaeon]|nr:sodium-dependent transporter [Candidatus Thermoplasmatota archaeon]